MADTDQKQTTSISHVFDVFDRWSSYRDDKYPGGIPEDTRDGLDKSHRDLYEWVKATDPTITEETFWAHGPERPGRVAHWMERYLDEVDAV
jgi:hypothetical protein